MTVTCGNCKKVGHNRSTCKNEDYVVQAPTRKRGRPPEIREDGGINTNPPKRRKVTQTQPSDPPTMLTQSQSSLVAYTAPQPSSTPQGASSIASSTAARGRERRGRPPGRGQARRQVSVPRVVGVYMCPFSNHVFECFGSHARDIGGNGYFSRSKLTQQWSLLCSLVLFLAYGFLVCCIPHVDLVGSFVLVSL